jgi:transposase
MPDALWTEIVPLLPSRQPHPPGCLNLRVDDCRAMDAIYFRLRTRRPVERASATGPCSTSSAHGRLQEWAAARVVLGIWQRRLTAG